MQSVIHWLHVALRWMATGSNGQTVGAVLLISLVPLLARQSWKRTEKREAELAALSPEERAEQTELENRRGRRIEDLWTLGVASAAAYLSSTGLRRFGHAVMGLNSPYDWLPFFALDVAALICGRRARRRARSGKGLGQSGVLMWVLACISSGFSASEASDVKGTVARAVWPLIAMYLFELGSMEERSAHRENMLGRAGVWLDRRLQAVRLVHPIEWVRVALVLASDADLSQTEATLQVRIARAAYWMYKLRLFKRKSNPWFGGPRGAWLDSRAQTALARVGRSQAQLTAVLHLVQLRAKTGEFAVLEYKNAQQALKAIQSMIGLGDQDSEGGTAGQSGRPAFVGRPVPGQAAYPGMANATVSGTGAAYPGTREAVPTGYPGTVSTIPTAYPGTAGAHPAGYPADAAAHPGTREAVPTGYPGTAQQHPEVPADAVSRQVRAGMAFPRQALEGVSVYVGRDAERDIVTLSGTTAGQSDADDAAAVVEQDGYADSAGMLRDALSDAELIALMLETIGEDGKLSTGGIVGTAKHYGIGKGRATRLVEAASEQWKAGQAEAAAGGEPPAADVDETLQAAADRQAESEVLLEDCGQLMAGQSPS